MNNNIIEVQNLSKIYRINKNKSNSNYLTLREQISHSLISNYTKIRGIFKTQNDYSKFDYYALNDINLEIQKGDTVGLIGKNGAGKSTLLKILSRITEPTIGRIVLKGRVASLLEVGTGFHPELTGRENIFLNGAILGMQRSEVASKFDEIVSFSGIEEFIDTPVKRYSSGMYVRLAFSVAAHLESDILFVDEVLAVGDAEFQKKCLGKLDDISSHNGRTVVFVSHSIESIRALCNKGILLEKGQIASVGDINSVIDLYTTNLKNSSSTIYKNETSFSDVYISLAKANEQIVENDNGNSIFIELEIRVNKKASFSIECILKNCKGVPIFFNSNGLVKNQVFNLNEGTYLFNYELLTPTIASGEYLVDFMVVNPGNFFYESIENCLIVKNNNSNIGRLVYTQNEKQGCVYLDANITIGNGLI
jgi:lipopolysaccharide transport system ATP-binding protein